MTEWRWKSLPRHWNRFFFEEADLSICGLIRIGFATLMLINVLTWAPDLERWFGEQGVIDFEASRAVVDSDSLTLFMWLPRTDTALWLAYAMLLIHTVGLLVGWLTRAQAIGVFVWFASFQHRNMLIFDGEDYLFRMLAFLLILLPAGHYLSVDQWWRSKRKRTELPRTMPVWPLRLMQCQVTLVYLSSAWEKLRAPEWIDGTALYYVSRLDDVFGRFPLPSFLFESMFLMTLMTWAVLAAEILIPIGLWFQESRRLALILAFGLHLAIAYSMSLFLFQPLMLVSLLVFVRWHPNHQAVEASREKH